MAGGTSYDIAKMSQYVDFINLKTYDFTKNTDNVLSHNAPLYGSGEHNVNATVHYWLNQGKT